MLRCGVVAHGREGDFLETAEFVAAELGEMDYALGEVEWVVEVEIEVVDVGF